MKLSRSGLILALLGTTTAALGAACSFPQIGFSSESASTTASSSATGASTATGASSATAGGGGSGGALGSSSSGGGSPPCGSDPCDCDGDGEKSWDCGGADCADYDDRANTKADFLLTDQPIQEPRRDGTQDFDFNCNGSVEGQIPPRPDCALLSMGLCGGSGFIAPAPGCGKPAMLGECKLSGLTGCKAFDQNISQTQGCR